MCCYEVLVAHLHCSKSYLYTSEVELEIGTIIQVDFSGKKTFGVVSEIGQLKANLKPIIKIFEYKIEPKIIEFAKNVAEYNMVTIGSVWQMIIPNLCMKSAPMEMIYKQQETYITLDKLLEQKIKRSTVSKMEKFSGTFLGNEVMLDETQKSALEKIGEGINFLVGVTGSGKTRVALEKVAKILNQEEDYSKEVNFKDNHEEANLNKSQKIIHPQAKILILVPEISLASTWSAVIQNRFGSPSFIYHNKMNAVYKSSLYKWAISQEGGFIIGARSALFLPYKNLKYIIIDEEHSASYKQESFPFYHAVDMAILKAKIENCPLLMMSATPRVESFYKCEKNEYNYVQLQRLPKHGLANIEFIKKQKFQLFAPEVLAQVRRCFLLNQQVLFFLNRKGYAPYCVCSLCHNVLKCKNCEIAKTFYQDFKLICHGCFFKSKLPAECPNCSNSTKWKFFGLGLEKVAHYLAKIFPENKFINITSDIEDMENALNEIHENKVDGIIATQILAQGHDFKNIALVVIVDADIALNSIDFRVTERMFQMWQQIRGRSGRAEFAGKMLIQYENEENKFIQLFKEEFPYKKLLQQRKEESWPPFSFCAFVVLQHKENLEAYFQLDFFKNSQLLGPLFIGKKNGINSWRFLFKSANKELLHANINNFLQQLPKLKGLNIQVEIEPYSF